MSTYYDDAATLRVVLNENSRFGAIEKDYIKAEWNVRGDFLIIYQEKLNTVIPLIGIDEIKVISDTNV
jgi:hypothetical protein